MENTLLQSLLLSLLHLLLLLSSLRILVHYWMLHIFSKSINFSYLATTARIPLKNIQILDEATEFLRKYE
jgi:hypothetical protein